MVQTPPNAVRFAGRHVNLSELSRMFMLDQSYLSRILSGKRKPSWTYAIRIAEALDMGLEQFLDEWQKIKVK
jgi:transcriptional regulator with XRE-family HTH domain